MSDTTKDTIYIDIDDEITSIIDKVKSSKHKIVALVLPKRAAMLQSIVNMKLLKKAAGKDAKKIVLITSDSNLMPLAGQVGLYVAKTLQSKPIIPPAPEAEEDTETVAAPEDDAEPVDKTRSVGELAVSNAGDEDETIEIDNDDELDAAGKVAEASVDGKEGKKDKGLRVPNFERFRMKLMLGVAALILLIVGWFYAFVMAPRAKVTITTDSSNQNVQLSFAAATESPTLDLENQIVPAVTKELKKTDNEKVPATGQKDLGAKASGTVTLKNCTQADGVVTIPAGTGMTTSGFTFVSNEAVELPASTFTGGGTCTTAPASVAVTAQNPGGQYNLNGGRTFTVSGFAGVNGVDSSAMSGGTTNLVKVVSEADVETAKQKVADKYGTIADEFKESMTLEGYVGIADTLGKPAPAATSVPKVGEEGSEVTVTIVQTFTMLGVKKDDLSQVVEAAANKQIDTAQQSVLDTQVQDGVMRVTDAKNVKQPQISYQGLVKIGPEIDVEALKKQIAGKKRGDGEGLIKGRPGVREVRIEYSPFWVFSTPKATKKITVNFQQLESNDTPPTDQ
jgi:hypothetical protein